MWPDVAGGESATYSLTSLIWMVGSVLVEFGTSDEGQSRRTSAASTATDVASPQSGAQQADFVNPVGQLTVTWARSRPST